MAVSYRSTGLYNSSGSTTAVVTAPAGLVNGDLVFVVIRRAAAVNPTGVPAGWTLLQSIRSTYGFWLYYKIANNEGASWTWTWAASAKTLGRSHAYYGNINPTTPIQSSTTPYSARASGTAISIPGLTTASDNTYSIIISSAYSTSAKTFTVPTSPVYTEHNDSGSTTPDFHQAIAGYSYPTSGTATGAISYPVSAASTYRIGCQVLINTIPPNLAPAAVVLNNPSDGSNTNDTTPSFNFSGSDPESDQLEYNIQIDSANTFDSQSGNPLVSAFSVSSAGFTAGHPYNSGNPVDYSVQTSLTSGTYYWRVAAIDPSGSNTYGDWSTIRSFSIVSNYAPTVVLNSPGDSAFGLSTTPTLNFTGTDAENDSIEYEIQIDTSLSFDSVAGPSGSIISDSFELTNWTSVMVSGTSPAWTRETTSTYPTGVTPQNGSYMARFNAYSCQSGQQARFYTGQTFNIPSGLANCSLSFWMNHNSEYTTNDDRVQLQISTNGGTDWVNVGTPVSRYNGNTGWEQATIDLSAYIGVSGIVIGFLGISAYGTDCHIDNVTINYTSASSPILIKKSETDTGFTPGHPFTSGSQVSFTIQPANALSDSTSYYWRVRGIDVLGGGVYGEWATVRSFSVGNLPPAINLVFPVEGQLVSTLPLFSFAGIDLDGDQIEYNIQIDTVNTFDSQSGNPLISEFSTTSAGFSSGHPYESGNSITYQVQSALALGAYYWRVSGIDPLGKNIYGDWSPSQSVTVVNNAPPHVVTNYPNDGCQGVPPSLTYSFTGTDSENDNIEYNIQVDDVNTFNSNGGGAPTVIYSESFESTGWTSVLVSGSKAAWTRAASSTRPSGITAQNGSYIAIFNSYTCSSGASARFYDSDNITITSGAAAARLSYWIYHETGYSTSNDKIQPQISRNGGTSWVNVGTAVSRYNGTTGWEKITVDLASYIGVENMRFAFLGTSGNGNDCHIDNVVIEYDLPLINRSSSSDPGFTSGHPYSSGLTVTYTSQSGEILTKGKTYYWRIRAIDPLGLNVYGMWSNVNQFTPNTGVKIRSEFSWQYKPIKIWNGSLWVEKPLKVWDGTSWVNKG